MPSRDDPVAGLALVGPQPVDPGALEPSDQRGRQLGGQRSDVGCAGGQVRDVGQALTVLAVRVGTCVRARIRFG